MSCLFLVTVLASAAAPEAEPIRLISPAFVVEIDRGTGGVVTC